MQKAFEINRTKIKGSCQSGGKVITHNSKSDLPLVHDQIETSFLKWFIFWIDIFSEQIWHFEHNVRRIGGQNGWGIAEEVAVLSQNFSIESCWRTFFYFFYFDSIIAEQDRKCFHNTYPGLKFLVYLFLWY